MIIRNKCAEHRITKEQESVFIDECDVSDNGKGKRMKIMKLKKGFGLTVKKDRCFLD